MDFLMDFSFPKTVRLLRSSQYRRVHSQGKRLSGDYMFLEVTPNHRAETRMGVSISRKYGKSVLRNRFKRCLREAFRLRYKALPSGYDFVVRPRKMGVAVDMAILGDELLRLLESAKEPVHPKRSDESPQS